MYGNDFGKGLGCVMVFAVIGMILAAALLILGVIWVLRHVDIMIN